MKGFRQGMSSRGSYLLNINVGQPLTYRVGLLHKATFPPGRYIYVGSARRGISSRIARHHRLAEQKAGKLHWHIDYLLVNPYVQWAGSVALEDGIECEISRIISSIKGVTAPVSRFGSSDCRKGCKAHLYLLPKSFRNPDLVKLLEMIGT